MEKTISYTEPLRRLVHLIRIAGRFRLAGELTHEETMEISDKDIKALFLSLNKHRVQYLLVGGFAVNIYGYQRTTNDIDLWVKEGAENMDRLIRALQEIGIPGVEHLKGNKLVPGLTELTFGMKNFRIDLMNYLNAFREADFDEVYERALSAEFAGVPFQVIHKDDLLREKRAAGRHKDLDDLENLTK